MLKAKQNSWKNYKISSNHIKLLFCKSLTLKEFEKVQVGFIPREMEDKWFIYFDENTLFFHRAWSGHCIFIVHFHKKDNLMICNETIFNIDNIESKKDMGIDKTYAPRLLHYLIDQLLLNRNIEFPYPMNIDNNNELVFQHHLVGSGTSNFEHDHINYKNMDNKILYESEIDEIITIFGYTEMVKELEVIKDSELFGGYNREFDERYNLFKEYCEKIDPWLKENDLTDDILVRYMIVGFFVKYTDNNLLDIESLNLKEIFNDETIKGFTIRDDLFEKYYGRKIKDKEDYFDLLGYNQKTEISGNDFFCFVIDGKLID